MSLSNSGAGFRLGGAIMMAMGVLLFAIVQTAAMVSTMREHLRAGAATTSTMLVLVGAVATAVGIVLGRLSRCTLVYVDRSAWPEPQSNSDPARDQPTDGKPVAPGLAGEFATYLQAMDDLKRGQGHE